VGMGSESSDIFEPFFVVARKGLTVRPDLSEQVLREAFGGVIWSRTRIWVEPLEERGEWWSSVLADCGQTTEEREPCLRPWQSMIAWFHSQKEFASVWFVMIGNDPSDGGAHFPRLAIGVTNGGSLAGIASRVTHT